MRISPIQHYVPEVSCALSLILNLLFIRLIVTKTRNNLGNYKYLMMSFAVFDILYAIADTIVKPLMFLYRESFIVFSSGILHERTTIGSEACCAICALFCASVTFLVLHFIYRYIVVCQPYNLYLFTWPYTTIWIGFVAFFTAYWGLVCYFFLLPDRNFREYIRGPFAVAFEDDTSNIGFVGALYYTVQNSTAALNWEYCIGIANLLFIQFTTFSIILYCGPHIYFSLTKVTLSKRTRTLQIQLFQALVAQTLLPLLLCYIPCTMIFLIPLSGLQLGFLPKCAPICLSLYPVMDPIVTMYFVREYRTAILGMFGWKPRSVADISITNTYVDLKSTVENNDER